MHLVEQAGGVSSSADSDRALEHLFRTAYCIASLDMPFSDLPGLVQLQMRNGAEIRDSLSSENACAKIIDHFAVRMQSTFSKYAIEKNSKMVILINISNIRSEHYNIFLKTDANESEPMFWFLDIFEVDGTTASTVVESLEITMLKHGFTEAWLTQNLIGFVTKGADEFFNKKFGLATAMQKKYPSIITSNKIHRKPEKGFTDMIKRMARLRNNLQIDNVSNFLFVAINGPRNLSDFDPKFFTSSWDESCIIPEEDYKKSSPEDDQYLADRLYLYELLS